MIDDRFSFASRRVAFTFLLASFGRDLGLGLAMMLLGLPDTTRNTVTLLFAAGIGGAALISFSYAVSRVANSTQLLPAGRTVMKAMQLDVWLAACDHVGLDHRLGRFSYVASRALFVGLFVVALAINM